MSAMPDPGSPAPDFDLPAAGGGRLTLSSLKGRTVVLYFYPKDDTTACTQEALSFSRHAADFAAAGAVVVGVSKDSPASHDRFKAKYGLDLDLVSDAETAAAQAYGVWQAKSMYGKTYMGMVRATFLIDAAGVVRNVWPKVKVAGHAEEVLAAARDLA